MPNGHPKRQVFYSFHFERDAWRAAQVRNMGATEHAEPVSDNDWEAIKQGGDAAIQMWINRQMQHRSCTIVLIGAQTANRKWVNYEIAQAWNNGKGLLGIYIHGLQNQDGQVSYKGNNPFSYVKLQDDSPLANYLHTYDPPGRQSTDRYSHIKRNLARWVERAINDASSRR